MTPHFLAPLLAAGASSSRFRIVTTDGRVVARLVEPAFDAATRKRGLLGRTSLDPGAALVIAPCSAVHTFFMRFPSDVVFVDREGRVTKITPELTPWRLAGSLRAFATVELASGSAGECRLQPGDRLIVELAE